MHLDQQRVGSGGNSSARHGRNFVTAAGAVRRVGGDGQVRELVHDRYSGDIQRVAGVGLKSANAALTHDHLVVAAGHQVFGGEQQFFQRGGDAALQQHRFAHFAKFAQQIEVLHVARAHLQDVDIRQHQRDLRDRHHLADGQHFELVGNLSQQLQPFLSQPLKRIG